MKTKDFYLRKQYQYSKEFYLKNVPENNSIRKSRTANITGFSKIQKKNLAGIYFAI
jgi:hypothetical protein